jgi:hypothetical protein
MRAIKIRNAIKGAFIRASLLGVPPDVSDEQNV